ncbi:MAG: hypothetical protein DWQ01_10950 [Planctomycetota bacterium]|nr:MAG: hypothetical protein DWQ01_10950 [Planctomycetota bacterium]
MSVHRLPTERGGGVSPTLNAKWILVTGTLQIGSPTEVLTETATIRLVDTPPDASVINALSVGTEVKNALTA